MSNGIPLYGPPPKPGDHDPFRPYLIQVFVAVGLRWQLVAYIANRKTVSEIPPIVEGFLRDRDIACIADFPKSPIQRARLIVYGEKSFAECVCVDNTGFEWSKGMLDSLPQADEQGFLIEATSQGNLL